MSTFGSNVGFVDELYARYLEDPSAVSEAWQEFFADYRRQLGLAPARAPEAPPPAPKLAEAAVEEAAVGEELEALAEPLRGISAKIAENMGQSLAVPTATSTRSIPVKLMEENRRVINQNQEMSAGPKVSFTHLMAWTTVRALERHPAMNAGYMEKGGKPYRVRRPGINLGLAIDTERKGERILLVPNLKNAQELDFPSFVAAYNDIINRARQNKLALEEFQGTSVTLTNPGMLGTLMSVPRLMAGQGTIVGVGSIGFPAEYAGMAPEVISELGLSKVMTVTSTYDHRIIQGAESGAFLATIEKLLLGADGFYQRIFDELAVPHEPLQWAGDQNPSAITGVQSSEAIRKQAMVLQLIRAHRVRGHLYADLDPLQYDPTVVQPELEMSTYGLTVWDLDRRFIAGGLAGTTGTLPLRDILDTLRQTYCRTIGVEYMHVPEMEPREWLQESMERTKNAEPIATDVQLRVLGKLNEAEAFERFLHTTYIGHKRFSLEGAETLIPMLDALFNESADTGVKAAVIGMAHRGRLNVLTNVIGKSYAQVFREFEGDIDPELVHGSGDVKYHLGAKGVHHTPDGRELQLTLAANPSHLEAVDPVVEGMVRALQNRTKDIERRQVIPVLVHGDAAFSGQGVVTETLNLSQLKGYTTGGTVHIVVNNQIGFTTGPKDARSSLYCTDVAKSVHAPIFHVNGDHPEDAVRVIKLALAWRQQWKRDVVIDLVCYRRWGHNEGDDPSYTNPVMYAKIEKRRSVRKLYTEQLLRRGDIDVVTAERSLTEFQQLLKHAHEEVRNAVAEPEKARPDLEEVEGAAQPSRVSTSVTADTIERILDGLERMPEGFQIHPKLERQLSRRRERVAGGRIDWALAESLAFGSLVLDGVPVRLSGEDSGRGTFSQRHAKVYDYTTGAPHIPLNAMGPTQARFSVYDSHLSEFAVLGFEYGYAVNHPEALVMWEAQFGDFLNGAQVVVDQFIASGEEKWGQRAGVTLLLPHGYEGQGPEHSSARVERFLQLAARGNLRICYPSTPASYFHLLRRQGLYPVKKPLVVFTPKSLLRLPDCVASREELTGGGFYEVMDDTATRNGKKVRRVVLCSGKVYYDLRAYQRGQGIDDVAIVRLEQYYPFPAGALSKLLADKYADVHDIAWVQEEPRNMGAWDFLDELLLRVCTREQKLRYVGRPPSASPATGSHKRHLAEQAALVEEAFATYVIEKPHLHKARAGRQAAR